jgi:hypothetical protein
MAQGDKPAWAMDTTAMAPRRDPADPNPLPSFEGVTQSLGTFLAGLEQKILHNRPPAAVVVEEDERSTPRSIHGLSIEMPEQIERPEPPDTTGARL